MTQIEEFLFGKLQVVDTAPFLSALSYSEHKIFVKIVSFPGQTHRIKAEFPNPVIEAISFDENETIDWPLDIIGFDCYQVGIYWRFVLHCTELEWIWQSEWPTVANGS